MPPAKPRIWPTIVFGAFFVPITWSVSKLLWSVVRASGLLEEGSAQSKTTRFVVQGLSFELICIAALFYFIRRSREAPGAQLGLTRSRLSLWLTPVIYFGAVGGAIVGGLINLGLIGARSPRVDEVQEQVRLASGGEIWIILLMVAVIAAFTEELIFRGFIQARLLRRFSPWVAISLSSLFFAITHGDISYAIAVFPLGLWFGYVAYLSESIWPSTVCHFIHNSFAVLIALGSSEGQGGEGQGDQAPTFDASFLLFGAIALLFVWWMARILEKRQRPRVALTSEHEPG